MTAFLQLMKKYFHQFQKDVGPYCTQPTGPNTGKCVFGGYSAGDCVHSSFNVSIELYSLSEGHSLLVSSFCCHGTMTSNDKD